MTETLPNPVIIERCIGLVRGVFELFPDEEFRRRVERGTRGFNVVHSRLSSGFVPVEVPSQEIIDRVFAEKRPLRESLDRLTGQPDRAKDLVPIVNTWLDSSELTKRERRVVEMSFGLDPTAEPVVLEEIGERFGVKRQTISQNFAKAKRKLRREDYRKPVIDFLQGEKDLMGKSG